MIQKIRLIFRAWVYRFRGVKPIYDIGEASPYKEELSKTLRKESRHGGY